MNKITSIIAAVNYDDLLDITLTENKHNFDETIIITDTKDIKTQQLTKKHNVKCFVTDIFYINNNKFNRGMAYNAVLSALKHELDWVVLMDADVVLTKDFKNLLELYNNINNIKRNMSTIETIITNNENNNENSIIKFNNMNNGNLFNYSSLTNRSLTVTNSHMTRQSEYSLLVFLLLYLQLARPWDRLPCF